MTKFSIVFFTLMVIALLGDFATAKKLTKIQVYLQDILGGPNQTVWDVAEAKISANSPTLFGTVRVLDNLMTAGPDSKSQKLGRAQGLVTFSDFEVTAVTMNLNFVFTAGKYKGSTLCVVGRNALDDDVREVAVSGGTGAFRFATGYAISTTYSFEGPTIGGVLGYTFYVAIDRPPFAELDDM